VFNSVSSMIIVWNLTVAGILWFVWFDIAVYRMLDMM
jgi:hypothetical protein